MLVIGCLLAGRLNSRAKKLSRELVTPADAMCRLVTARPNGNIKWRTLSRTPNFVQSPRRAYRICLDNVDVDPAIRRERLQVTTQRYRGPNYPRGAGKKRESCGDGVRLQVVQMR